jgi:hypothetical protein
MTDRYKLIYHQLFPDQTQFFDIQEDPRELEDLAQRGLPEMQEMMGRLDGLDAYSNFLCLSTSLRRFGRSVPIFLRNPPQSAGGAASAKPA